MGILAKCQAVRAIVIVGYEYGGLMEPGRELDALIAEKVMGLHITKESRHTDCPVYDIQDAGRFFAPISPYSTSIAAAWEVVEKVADPWVWSLSNYHGEWESELTRIDIDHQGVYASAPTAPLAICHAALKAIE